MQNKAKKKNLLRIRKHSHTLGTTLFLMCACPLMIIFILGIVFSFISQKHFLEHQIIDAFEKEANRKIFEFNVCFDSTEKAVNAISDYILNSFDSKKASDDADYMNSYMENLDPLLVAFAKTTRDVVSVYFRPDIELYGPHSGLFLTGNNKTGFLSILPEDISLYSTTDVDRVGWYYIPQWEGSAIWSTPYVNNVTNMQIISYLRPLYKNGSFLGLVGMDINLATIKSITDDIKTENMSALILGKDFNLIYYNSYEALYPSVDTSLDIRGMRQTFSAENKKNCYEVKWDNQNYYASYNVLKNNMKLVLLIQKSILLHQRNLSIIRFLLIFAFSVITSVLILRIGYARIIAPVNELTEAAYRLSRGELGIPIAYHSNNELGYLADSIRKMASQLSEYIDYIREQTKSEREAKESAISASKAKSNFLANMSHEIRTPINAVLGMNEMILRETKRDDIKVYATNIKHAGNALLALVNDVLDFSKIESGKMELLPDTYNLSSVLIDLITIISERVEKTGLELKLNINKDIPSVLYGDSAKLKQCILNLLTNAVKYTNKGSVTFNLDFKEIPYSDGKKITLLVRISDTGIGIKKEDIDKLFLPFERIEENRNRTVEGTGLGMNIVQRILDIMDSKLEIQSKYGHGSSFSFSVLQDVVSDKPLGDIMAQYNDKIRMTEVYKEKLFAPDAKILFIDDTVMNLEVVKGLLKNTLIQLDTALSGEEGLELAKQNAYDILFIDHRMPKMDGLETLEALKGMKDNKSAGKPCIALTANAISGAKEMYIAAGFTDYLAKPVNPEKLEEMIRKYLPEEMIKTEEEMEDLIGAKDAKESKDSEASAFPEIDGIDLETARTYCGSDELMRKMFAMFQSSVQTNSDELEKLLNAGDIAQFKIKVHALKSSARTIGAVKLSQKALDMETAASENDIQKLKRGIEPLLNLYRSYIDKLLVFAAPKVEKKGESFSETEIKEKLSDMSAACENFDLDTLEGIVGDFQMRDLPDNFKDNFKKIREFVKNVDFDSLSAFLNELM